MLTPNVHCPRPMLVRYARGSIERIKPHCISSESCTKYAILIKVGTPKAHRVLAQADIQSTLSDASPNIRTCSTIVGRLLKYLKVNWALIMAPSYLFSCVRHYLVIWRCRIRQHATQRFTGSRPGNSGSISGDYFLSRKVCSPPDWSCSEQAIACFHGLAQKRC